MNPKVSVIVPVYNGEKYISRCLDSITKQNYLNIEIIIINDGSNDESESIIKMYKKRDSRIVYYSQQNKGPSEARNKGILNATGKYLVFIDADDTVDKYYVEFLLNKMIDSNSDLVCCGYRDISKYGILNYTDFDFEKNISIQNFMEMICQGTGGVLWGKIYKKEIITKYDFKMDKEIFMCEDLIFVLQYASRCKTVSAIKDYLYYYNRLNENSISSNISIHYIENYINVWKRIERIFYSVPLEKNKINEILTKSIQDFVLGLIEKESVRMREIGIRNATSNIKEILSIYEISNSVHLFSSSNVVYKVYIFLVKKDCIRLSIFYGVFLNMLRGLKRRIKTGGRIDS